MKRSEKRNQVVLISKGGHPSLFPIPNMHKFRLSKEEMTKDLDGSLSDLGTYHIDIYLYHRDDPKRPVEELIETMEGFVRAGKIRYYGVSNWTLPKIIEAQAIWPTAEVSSSSISPAAERKYVTNPI